MQAYLDGINVFIATKELPFEYRLINARPEPFDMHDVYCATGFMSYCRSTQKPSPSSTGWRATSIRPSSTCTGTKRISTFPGRVCPASLASPTVHNLDALRPVPQWLGSNAGASGDRTASGEVLGNDAYIAYLAFVVLPTSTPEIGATATTLVACRFPSLATRDHAWGITMFVNDDIDLYRETLDGTRYSTGRGFPQREPTIEVAEAPVTFEVRETHHGPLIEEDVAMWWAFTQYRKSDPRGLLRFLARGGTRPFRSQHGPDPLLAQHDVRRQGEHCMVGQCQASGSPKRGGYQDRP